MHLQPATLQDWKLLLDWRNDIDTRRNSNTMEAVSEHEHREWLQSVISSGNRLLFIGYEDDIAVGTVRADLNEQSGISELSWTTAPQSRGKGYGKLMVKMLAEKVGGKLLAKIKPGNVTSIKIAENAGLKFSHEDEGVLVYTNF